MASACGAMRGRSVMTVASTFTTRNPPSRSRRTAEARSSMESAPACAGSVSGKSAPMSPRPAAPRIASVIACATASPSECPFSPGPPGIATPPAREAAPHRSGGSRSRHRSAPDNLSGRPSPALRPGCGERGGPRSSRCRCPRRRPERPGGICAHDRSASSPPSVPAETGTPITGSEVCAATTPGSAADSPAPQITTEWPAAAAPSASSAVRLGCRCAELTSTCTSTPCCCRIATPFSMVGMSDSDPIITSTELILFSPLLAVPAPNGQTDVVAAETEGVRERDLDVPLNHATVRVFEIALGIRFLEV